MAVKIGRFEVKQNGMVVASGEGPMEEIAREAIHYAVVYLQDGPIEMSVKEIKKETI